MDAGSGVNAEMSKMPLFDSITYVWTAAAEAYSRELLAMGSRSMELRREGEPALYGGMPVGECWSIARSYLERGYIREAQS